MDSHLWRAVIDRDAHHIWEKSGSILPYHRWRAVQAVICMAKFFDPKVRHHCDTRQTVEHIKDQLGMQMKAPDDLKHMVASCWVHNAHNPPSKRLRATYRDYLEWQNRPTHHD